MEIQTPLTPMVKSVKDLKFKVKKSNVNIVEAKHTFENGITILLEGGEGCFGDGYETFEVAVWTENQLFKLDNNTHFLDWACSRQINEIIQKILENKLK